MSLECDAELLVKARKLFQERFGAEPTHCGSAPGRVNIIGEHVDYCDGFVLPMALEKRTLVLGRATGGKSYTFVADSAPEDQKLATFTPSDLATPTHATAKPGWVNYIMGVLAQFDEVPGVEAVVVSNVPIGGGLSSSAALEVSTHIFVESLLGKVTDGTERAQRCQKAEHDWANVPCGIMDQSISSLASEGHLLLLDCRSLTTQSIILSDPNLAVIVCDSNVKHELNGSEYPTRRRQTVEVLAAITKKFPEIKSLRDATLDQLEAVKADIDPIVYARGRHVIEEIARTTQFADLVQAGKWEEAGKLMYDSHWSLSKNFEVSTPELDELVTIASKTEGVFGSRMTGGGFGGCTVTLVQSAKAEDVMKALTQGQATAFITKAGMGARIVSL